MIIFFYGEDTFRLKQKIKALKQRFISASLGDTNLAVLEGKGLGFDQAVRQILAMPFLSRKRLVIVENLLKVGLKDTQEKMADFLKKVPDTTVLVFMEEGLPDRRLGLFRKLNSATKSQEFKLPENEGLRRWILKEVENRQGKIEPAATSRLIEYVGNDLWRLSHELDKLVAYKSKVTSANIELLTTPQIQTNIFSLIEKVAAKNTRQAMHELCQLFQSGFSEIYILTMIAYQYRNLLIIKDIQLRSPRISRGELIKQSGLHPFVLTKNLALVGNYDLKGLRNIYQKILNFDTKIKTGKIEPRVALELLIFDLTTPKSLRFYI